MKILITVDDGIVQEVFTTEKPCVVEIIDYDAQSGGTLWIEKSQHVSIEKLDEIKASIKEIIEGGKNEN